jgi:hypothetical protein
LGGRERSVLNVLRSRSKFITTWPLDEPEGDVVSLANNIAVDLGRNVATLTYAAYVAGANWANPSGQIARHTAGSTATIRQNGIIAAGKTWEYIVVMSNRTAGSVSITGGDAPVSSNGSTTVTITATGADVIITPTSDFDGDIDLAQGTVKLTGILASSAYPGAELFTTANAASDPAGNEADATTGFGTSTATATSDATVKAVGDYSIKHVSIGGNGSTYYDLSTLLTNGKRYGLSFYTRHLGYDGQNTVYLSDNVIGTTTPLITLTSADTVFQLVTHEFTHDITNSRYFNVRENSATNDGGAYLDSISFAEANPLNGDDTGTTKGAMGNSQMPSMTESSGSGVIDVLSAEHNSIFDPLSFEIQIAGKFATWDATVRTLLNYEVDADNYIRIEKTAVAGQLACSYKEQGQAVVTVLIATGSPTTPFVVGIGVESNVMQVSFNGSQTGGDQATTGSFIGNFTIMTFLAEDLVPNKSTVGAAAYPSEFSGLLSANDRQAIALSMGVI